MGFRTVKAIGCLALGLVSIATAAAQDATPDTMPQYKLTDLGAVSGYSNSRAYGLNNKGQVVGQVMNLKPKLEAHAAIWADGKVQVFAVPDNLAYGSARSINDAGRVVGGAEIQNYGSNGFNIMGLPDKAYIWQDGSLTPLAADGSHAYAINNHGMIAGEADRNAVIWENRKITKLNTPSEFFSGSASAINDKGEAAGLVVNEQGKRQAALWRAGKMQLLGKIADDDQSVAGGINDMGQVAGSSGKNGWYWSHPFLWNNGVMKELPALDGDPSDNQVLGINNKGSIVGCGHRDGKMNAVLWEKGQVYDLNDLISDGSGLILMKAIAINDKGQIVGEARDSKIQIHAFLLTPITK